MVEQVLAPRLAIGIDPGPGKGGLVVYDTANREIANSEQIGNPARGYACVWPDAPLHLIRGVIEGLYRAFPDQRSTMRRVVVGIERFRSQGVINADIIRSIETYGRIREIAHDLEYRRLQACFPVTIDPLYRADVLRHLDALGAKGRDRVVRERMITEHGGTRAAATGRKAAPGPLYGCASHAWQALAVAYVAADRAGILGPRRC